MLYLTISGDSFPSEASVTRNLVFVALARDGSPGSKSRTRRHHTISYFFIRFRPFSTLMCLIDEANICSCATIEFELKVRKGRGVFHHRWNAEKILCAISVSSPVSVVKTSSPYTQLKTAPVA